MLRFFGELIFFRIVCTFWGLFLLVPVGIKDRVDNSFTTKKSSGRASFLTGWSKPRGVHSTGGGRLPQLRVFHCFILKILLKNVQHAVPFTLTPQGVWQEPTNARTATRNTLAAQLTAAVRFARNQNEILVKLQKPQTNRVNTRGTFVVHQEKTRSTKFKSMPKKLWSTVHSRLCGRSVGFTLYYIVEKGQFCAEPQNVDYAKKKEFTKKSEHIIWLRNLPDLEFGKIAYSFVPQQQQYFAQQEVRSESDTIWSENKTIGKKSENNTLQHFTLRKHLNLLIKIAWP